LGGGGGGAANPHEGIDSPVLKVYNNPSMMLVLQYLWFPFERMKEMPRRQSEKRALLGVVSPNFL
jgi:hypothetical protein